MNWMHRLGALDKNIFNIFTQTELDDIYIDIQLFIEMLKKIELGDSPTIEDMPEVAEVLENLQINNAIQKKRIMLALSKGNDLSKFNVSDEDNKKILEAYNKNSSVKKKEYEIEVDRNQINELDLSPSRIRILGGKEVYKLSKTQTKIINKISEDILYITGIKVQENSNSVELLKEQNGSEFAKFEYNLMRLYKNRRREKGLRIFDTPAEIITAKSRDNIISFLTKYHIKEIASEVRKFKSECLSITTGSIKEVIKDLLDNWENYRNNFDEKNTKYFKESFKELLEAELSDENLKENSLGLLSRYYGSKLLINEVINKFSFTEGQLNDYELFIEVLELRDLGFPRLVICEEIEDSDEILSNKKANVLSESNIDEVYVNRILSGDGLLEIYEVVDNLLETV